MRKIYSADIEADGFIASKIHCLSITEFENTTDEVRSWTITKYDEMREVLSDPDIYWLFHNGCKYDFPTLLKVLGCKIAGNIIDTLPLSNYIYPKRHIHGLGSYREDFGHAKEEVEDWLHEDISVYIKRCETDVKIQNMMWKKIWKSFNRLYNGKEEDIWRVIDHLTFKHIVVAKQLKSKWKLDVEGCKSLVEELTEKKNLATSGLESAMPMVPVIVKKTRPKKPFKKSGELSAIGEKWKKLTDEEGLDFDYTGEISVISKYKEPNSGSTKQVKGWLLDLGWVPSTFEYKRDKETGTVREIPQIKIKDTGEVG